MTNIKEIEKKVKETLQKLDFYDKMQKEAIKLGIDNLIDFENYLKLEA